MLDSNANRATNEASPSSLIQGCDDTLWGVCEPQRLQSVILPCSRPSDLYARWINNCKIPMKSASFKSFFNANTAELLSLYSLAMYSQIVTAPADFVTIMSQ